jgi:3-oxoacyl-[acyl-carrier-protein] synthase III
MQIRAGILGIGVYLPETVRTNDFWSPALIAHWKAKTFRRTKGELPVPMSEGVRRVIAAMEKLEDDPFNGGVERRAMRPDELSSEMEIAAGREAIKNSGVDPQDIDAVISFTFCPDYLNTPTGCIVHEALGLGRRCMTFSMEGACNSFPIQLGLADQMIRSGTSKNILLIQSAGFSKTVSADSPMSPWFGDGATAVVVGRVAEDRGIIAQTHRTDGTRNHAVVCGIPGKQWYDDGQVIAYAADPPMAQAIVVNSAERSRQIIPELLEQNGFKPTDIDFYACHQGMPWLREVTQEYCGMTNARWVDTYKNFASLSGANIPLLMSIGLRERQLRDGDLVVVFSGGTGETWSSLIMRWGRG